MSSEHPDHFGHDAGGSPASGRSPARWAPTPEELNPTWMGRVRAENYVAPAYASAPAAAASPSRSRGRGAKKASPGVLTLLILGAVLSLLSLILLTPLLLSRTGVAGFTSGFLASLIPLSIVLTAVYFMDRWEPEPKLLLLFALFWGGSVAVAATTLVQPLFMTLAPEHANSEQRLDFMVTVQAPVVEEVAKGLGLLLIALLARKHFDGPVDGLVYAFTIAAGFAFTENILYFGRQYASSEGSDGQFWALVFLRGIMSPFAHALFTGMTGLCLGFAARRWNRWLTAGAFVLGLVPAIFLHNRWNSMGADFLWLYLVIQLPLFALAVVGFVFLRRAEVKLTRRRLSEYAQYGWLSWPEVTLYASGAGRRRARRWAKATQHSAGMRSMIRATTALAQTRQRILTGRDTQRLQVEELRLLHRIAQLRSSFLYS